jgi:hypothetical protein
LKSDAKAPAQEARKQLNMSGGIRSSHQWR